MRCMEYERVQPVSWVLDVIRQILHSIQHHTQSVYNRLSNRTERIDESSLYLIQIAIGLEPDPMGIAHVFSRMPYSNPEYIRRDLKNAVAAGWLETIREGVYQTSSKGQLFFQQICKEVERVYRDLNPMPLPQLERLNGLLREVVGAIYENRYLSYQPSFDLDMRLGKEDGPVLQRICCNLSNLMAYRDDAYVNAWMEQDINSYVWEAFSYIYRGKAQTASEIAETLEIHRNYDVETYESALRELEERGWITQTGGKFEPTDQGIRVLAKVARLMNKKYFEPWMVLNENELKTLRDLLESLADSLRIRRPKYGVGYASINRTLGWGSIRWARDKIR
jgi:DNA-binding PadR family transcriptional regulator